MNRITKPSQRTCRTCTWTRICGLNKPYYKTGCGEIFSADNNFKPINANYCINCGKHLIWNTHKLQLTMCK